MVWECLMDWRTGDLTILISAVLIIWLSENIWECLRMSEGMLTLLTDWLMIWKCLRMSEEVLILLTDWLLVWEFLKKTASSFFQFFSDIQIIRETGCQWVSYSQTIRFIQLISVFFSWTVFFRSSENSLSCWCCHCRFSCRANGDTMKVSPGAHFRSGHNSPFPQERIRVEEDDGSRLWGYTPSQF